MARLLYIECSPRKSDSYSCSVGRQFLKQYKESHPGDTVDILDLWSENLPSVGGYAADAKYVVLGKQVPTGERLEAWNEILAIISRFKAADKYVVSIPMWNFTIPYVLKHYIDLIVQPGQTFGKNAEGKLVGLVTGRPMVCITASGSKYGPDSPLRDFLRPYLEFVLGFIGFSDLQFITIAPTTAGAEAAESAKRAAEAEAKSVASDF